MPQLAEELDMSMPAVSEPAYQFIQRVPQEGNSVAISTSVSQSTFELPQEVINFSKSYITFDLLATSAFGVLHLNKVPFDSIRLQTKGGIILAEISSLDLYSKTVGFANCDESTYNSNTPFIGSTTTAGAILKGNFMAPAGALTTDVSAAANLNCVYVGEDGAGTPNASATPLTAISGADKSIHFQQSLQVIATTNGIKCRVPFRQMCPHTLLGQNKEFYFGDLLDLVINWLPLSKIGWTTNAAATPVGANTTLTSVAVSNFYLQLCVDRNSQNVSIQRENFKRGYNVITPYIAKNYISSLGSGTSNSYSLSFNQASGRNLLRVYTSVILSNDQFAGSKNTENTMLVAGTSCKKVSQFESFLDSRRIQDKVVNCFNNEDWDLMRVYLEGSAYISERTYKANWVWADNFANAKRSCEWNDSDKNDSGVPLGPQSLLYTFNIPTKTAVAHTVVAWAVCNRVLNFSPAGVKWVGY